MPSPIFPSDKFSITAFDEAMLVLVTAHNHVTGGRFRHRHRRLVVELMRGLEDIFLLFFLVMLPLFNFALFLWLNSAETII